MREVARLNFEGKLQAVAEEKGKPTQTLNFGNWTATVSYGISPFGYGGVAHGNSEPIGRALIAKIGENEFLVTGAFCRVDFKAALGGQRDFLRVEELGPAILSKTSWAGDSARTGGGRLEDLRFIRLWNGDETDWGLDFGSAPQVLRVSLGTY
jgi:hypothetical protein